MKEWLIFVFLFGAMVAFVWLLAGPRRAVAAAVLLGLLIPEWVQLNVSPTLWATARLSLVIFALLLYLLHGKSTYNFKLVWSDFALLGLIGVHLASDFTSDGVSIAPVLRAYGEWFVPYMAGRVAIQTVADARWTLPIAVFVCALLAVTAVGEAYFAYKVGNDEHLFNVFEFIAKARPDDKYAPRYSPRMGLNRAYGPTEHPLFFGCMMFCLVPWAIYAASRAWRGQAPKWWLLAPVLPVVAMGASVSRGPILALAIVVFAMQLVQHPQRRKWLAPLGAVLIGGVVLFGEEAIDLFESFTPEAVYNTVAIVDGKEEKWTSTRHRLLLIREYDGAVFKGGLLGWGTARCNSFPLQVPREVPPPLIDLETGQVIREPARNVKVFGETLAPQRKKNVMQLDTVDNAFLLYTLRFGFAGLICFSALCAAGAYQFVTLATLPKIEGATWLAAMAGGVFGMIFLLITVFMAPDFGLLFLFMLGASAGLTAEIENPLLTHQRDSNADEPSGERRHRRRRRRSHRKDSSEPEESPA